MAEADCREQGAGRNQHRIGGQTAHGLGGQHADRAEGDCQQATQKQDRLAEARRGAGAGAEDQQRKPEDDINADLGQDREDGGDRRCRGRIGCRQPEAQRPHAGLHQEGDTEHARSDLNHLAVIRRERHQFHREIGHIERAGRAIDQADADQEERRGSEVDSNVMQARLDAERPGAVQQQAVGCRQHHLEEDEEVEEVAGQERAVETGDQQLEQRMEVMAGRVPARDRIGLGGKRQSARQAQHQRRQAVEHQHDAEGRRPVAELIDAAAGGGAVHRGDAHQHHREDEKRERRDEAHHALHHAVALVDRDHRGTDHQWQQDRQNQQVVHPVSHGAAPGRRRGRCP
ncbi:hypothetical protein D9M72_409050 [compost metagenome]